MNAGDLKKGLTMCYKPLPDEYINRLFEGYNFGEATNNSVLEKRKLIAETLQNQVDGFWCGHKIYGIVVFGGFLINAKFGEKKTLTLLGSYFLRSYI